MSADTLSAAPLQVFNLPDLGEGLTEAELVNWLVEVGDEIVVDQPVAEVETAKSVVEVPSPFAGTVSRLHGKAGETLDVGKPLISVRPVGAADTADSGSDDDDVAAAAAAVYREEERAGISPPENTAPVASPERGGEKSRDPDGGNPDGRGQGSGEKSRDQDGGNLESAEQGSGNVLIGYGTPGGLSGGRKRRPWKASSPEPLVPDLPEDTSGSAGSNGTGAVAVRCISPLVRKLARDAGLELRSIEGTGEQGVILRRDVEQALDGRGLGEQALAEPAISAGHAAESGMTEGRQGTSGTATAHAAHTGHGVDGADDTDRRSGLAVASRTPMKGVRRTVADNMSRSRREIPEATVWVDVDATALFTLRAELKRRDPENTPGLLAFIARFVLAGLARYPELNTRVVAHDDGSQEIIGFRGVNLGIAAQTERGLMVPCVQRADELSARGLDAEIRRLTGVVREGKATPAELTSGTFTLNNYGVFGVDGSAAIINHPEAAILGVGRIMDRPWVVDGELMVRKVTELTLTFDHRVCDGGVAGGFLRYVADAIESPGSLLADL